MKQFSKKYIIIASVCTLLYAWILGICGLYGETAAHYLQTAMLFTLKYGGSAFGLFLLWFVPARIIEASAANQKRYEEAVAAAKEKIRVQKMIEEEKIKNALAEHYEDLKND